MKPPAPAPAPFTCEICLLAGGLSTRMGRDKARLRLGRRTLLGHVRAAARATGRPVRLIRRDLVARCGPLGGIYTALKTSRADAVLFLACDMPFVSAELLQKLLRRAPRSRAVFTGGTDRAGFPFLLRRATLPVVESQLAAQKFSIQSLAKKLRAKIILPPGGPDELFNINTPVDWRAARLRLLTTEHFPIPRTNSVQLPVPPPTLPAHD